MTLVANLISTVYTYELDGSTTEYPIHFDYLARKFVVVTLIGQDRKVLKLNEDYRFAEKRKLSLTKAWSQTDGYDLIEIRRITPATDRLVDFSDGSILRAIDLNISAIQALHVAEEARDLTADTIAINNDGDLDARGKRIVNVADPINDGDALNLRTVKGWNESALTAQEAAKGYSEVSLAHSKESERQKNLALNAAKSSQESANKSAASASESASSANDSAESALQSSGSATKSEDCMQRACECASKAALSEKNTKDSEEVAKQYKEDAGNEANRAKTEADRAEKAADDAVAGGIKPSDLTQTITEDKLKAPSNFAVNTALKEQDPRQWGFGAPKELVVGADLDKLRHSGRYAWDNMQVDHNPTGSAWGNITVYPRTNGQGCWQIAWGTDKAEWYLRSSPRATSPYSPWVRMYHTGNTSIDPNGVLTTKQDTVTLTTNDLAKETGNSHSKVMTQKATVEYVETADVSNTKIDGKAIKTYIADAVKAGGGGLNGTLGAVGSVAFLSIFFKSGGSLKPGDVKTGGKYAVIHRAGGDMNIYEGAVPAGSWRFLGGTTDSVFTCATLATRTA